MRVIPAKHQGIANVGIDVLEALISGVPVVHVDSIREGGEERVREYFTVRD